MNKLVLSVVMMQISAADDEDTAIKGIYTLAFCSLSECVVSVEKSETLSEAMAVEREAVGVSLVTLCSPSEYVESVVAVTLSEAVTVIVEKRLVEVTLVAAISASH